MAEDVSVLVNTFNYGRFVGEAVASALAQTRAPAEIVVIDDGSSDDTGERMRPLLRDGRVRYVRQRNAGQLAAFVAGIEQASGDLLFFLDADDRYEPDHLAGCAAVFRRHHDIEFLFTGHRQFGTSEAVCQLARHDRWLGLSAARTFFRRAWIGSVTSTLAMRRSLALTLLPALRSLAPRWRIRADDCLVLGASLAGATKYFRAEPTVGYRTHATNHFHGKGGSPEGAEYAHWLRRDALVAVCARELGVRPEIGARAEVEFRTIQQPTATEYADYRALIRDLPLPVGKRWKMRLRLWQTYRRRWKPAPAEEQTDNALPSPEAARTSG